MGPPRRLRVQAALAVHCSRGRLTECGHRTASRRGGKYFCVAAEAGRRTGGRLLCRMFVMLAGPFVPSLSKHEWPSKQCPAFALRQAQDERNEARTCGDTILEGRPPPPQLLRRYARISH